MRHTLICVSIMANLIQLVNLGLFNSAHMGSFTPRFHHNRFRVEPVFEIMAFAATALFPQFIGFLRNPCPQAFRQFIRFLHRVSVEGCTGL